MVNILKGIFSARYFLSFFPLPFLHPSLPKIKVNCYIQKHKMEENRRNTDRSCGNQLACMLGGTACARSYARSVPLPRSLLTFPSVAGAAWDGSWLAFLLLSPMPRALGMFSCTLSLPFIPTAGALCPSVLCPQSQEEPLSMSSARVQSAPSVPPLLLPSCSHSLGDELFTLSTC